MLTIKYQGQAVQTALGKLIAALDNPQPMLHKIGREMAESTMRRFPAAKAPDGTPWAPKGELAQRKSPRTKHKPLQGETLALATGIIHQVRGQTIEIGSAQEYAAVHQFGAAQGSLWQGRDKRGRRAQSPWGDIPARPYLGINAGDEQTIIDIVQEYLGRNLS
ncbi:phage virion morphogenesis protein [Vandammella animalimorsus]|uniref:Phage virion morphogenesis protein n=1 Tax=Vandammella animalimorsus TaxID=2029117 RepID=A0A3M6RV33_9BURK|nr:phage virion morphogenesis protein [Vandammella animalimorsus]MDO4706717.1 phage virion morphogenesis protein [Comamonadaceae bacterium]RMX18898.1 phage virion morphogenesis protein [Vandammella animalimorsus]